MTLGITSADLEKLDYGFLGTPFVISLVDETTQDDQNYPAFLGCGITFNTIGTPAPPPTPSTLRSITFILTQ